MNMQVMTLRTAALIALCIPGAALAYIDPGSGSLLLQGLIALIGGIITTMGVYWRATLALFNRLFRRRPPADKERDPGSR